MIQLVRNQSRPGAGLFTLLSAVLADGCDNQDVLRRAAMANGSESVIMQDPEIRGGEPVFRGTRVPFQTLLDYLEGGETLDEFLEQYPGVSREQAIAALEEAKALVLARFGKWKL
jgi:uncharacterized protein (DUF433 family)